MRTKFSLPVTGELWTVRGINDAYALILVGPFQPGDGAKEVVVAAVYPSDQEGFRPTSEDFEISVGGRVMYTALWNTRPVAEADLLGVIGVLTSPDFEAVRDAYWGIMDGSGLPTGDRFGPVTPWWRGPQVRRFQNRELERWAGLSGVVLTRQLGLGPPPSDEMSAPVQQITAVVDGLHSTWMGAAMQSLLVANPNTIHEDDLPVAQWVLLFSSAERMVVSVSEPIILDPYGSSTEEGDMQFPLALG